MTDLETAVAELHDRAAVVAVVVEYARAVDDRDFERVARCFAPTVDAEYGGRRLAPGVDGLVAYLRERTAVLRASTHLMGNIAVELDGDRARAHTDGVAWLVSDDEAGAPRLRVRGLRYDDELIRAGRGWWISRRVHRALWMFDATALDPSAHRLPLPR